MSLTLLLGLLFIAAIISLVLRPLLLARAERRTFYDTGTDEYEELLFEREALLTALRDIQLDREMGKLSEEDFSALEARYKMQAIQVLKELDAMTDGMPAQFDDDAALDAWIEAAVRARRVGHDKAASEEIVVCGQCGSHLRPDDRFCSYCGAPVTAAEARA